MDNQSLVNRLGIDSTDRAKRLKWIGLNEAESSAIRKCAPYLQSVADEIIDKFYQHSQESIEWAAKVRESGSTLERLKGAQKAYFLQILSGSFDAEYFEHRLRVGLVHAKLNVEPRWNVGNYATYGEIVFPLLERKFKGKELVNMIVALNKAFILDVSLAIETYISEGVLEQLVEIHDSLGIPLQGLSASVREVASAAHEIATAVADIAQGASAQTGSLADCEVAMEDLSTASATVLSGAQEQLVKLQSASESTRDVETALQRVSEAAATATGKSAASLHAATEGTEAVQQTVEAMSGIRATVLGTASEIHRLGEQGSQIGAIVEVIDDIAGQTNLLALNAAIEAARAGEQGRGFAVVAENVRSLAERTAVATKEIAGLIAGVQQSTAQAVKAMEKSIADVENGTTRAEAAGAALNRIVETAAEVQREVESMSREATNVVAAAMQVSSSLGDVTGLAGHSATTAGQMNGSSQRVVALISGANTVAQESAASSQQVAATVEEVSAQTADVASRAAALASTIEILASFIARFGVLAHNARGERFVPAEQKRAA